MRVAYLVQLGRELVAAGTFGSDGPEFDWNYTLMNTKRTLDLPDYYIRMAWDDDNMPCGFVAGHLTPFFFSPQADGCRGWMVRACRHTRQSQDRHETHAWHDALGHR